MFLSNENLKSIENVLTNPTKVDENKLTSLTSLTNALTKVLEELKRQDKTDELKIVNNEIESLKLDIRRLENEKYGIFKSKDGMKT